MSTTPQSGAVRRYLRAIAESVWVALTVSVFAGLIIAGPVLLIEQYADFDIISSTNPAILFGIYVAQYVVTLLLLVFLANISVDSDRQGLRKLFAVSTKPNLLHVFWAFMGVSAYYLVYLAFVVIVGSVSSFYDSPPDQDIGFDSLVSRLDYALAFLSLVVLAPVVEELVFRGYLFSRLRRLVAFLPAAILVSIAFAVVHLNLYVAIDVFFLSIVLCYLVEKTGVIWPAILVHAAKNGVAFYFLFIATS